MTKKTDIESEAEDVRFAVVRSIIYHSSRRRWLQGLDRFSAFLMILLGTATASTFASELVEVGFPALQVIGGAVAVIGSLQLVYAFGARAKDHELLYRDYFRLFADIDGATGEDARTVASWKKRLAEIASAEPPTLRVLDAIAHNAAAQALYTDERPILKVHWWQNAFSQLYSFPGTVFEEIEPRSLVKRIES